MTSPHAYDALVIGAGHNGLACACYLARAGMKVLVLERADRVGGAAHTAATIADRPEYLFDTCSVVHNMINMTTVPAELRLADMGLEYTETDPFTVSFFPDGSSVRLYRSLDRTCGEIARHSPRDADSYRAFIREADPIVETALAGFRASGDEGSGPKEWGRRLASAYKALRRAGPLRAPYMMVSPYGTLLEETFETEHARVGFAALAAHATAGPHSPTSGFFVLWQAAYHRYGNWHAKGGSGALTQAMHRRLESWGGEVRTGARVDRLLVQDAPRRVTGVRLAGGEEIAAPSVICAINPQTALFDLLGETYLEPALARRLRARHRSNAVQFVVHAALDRLPPWHGHVHGDPAHSDVWNGMQSVAASVNQVRQNFLQAEAGIPPAEPAAYVFTPSAIDSMVAPPGKHGAYVACASYPSRFADGTSWRENGEREAWRLLDAVEARAPGFKDAVTGVAWRHAVDWEEEIGLLGGHPMHLDMTPDQMLLFRPDRELADHRGPVPGLYLSGAGTSPGGGVSAVPGRAAARAVLDDRGPRDRGRT